MRVFRLVIFMLIIAFPTLSYSCDDEEKNAPNPDYIDECNVYENISDTSMEISDTSYDFPNYGVIDNNISGIDTEAVIATGIWSQNLAPLDNVLSPISVASTENSSVDNSSVDTVSVSSPDVSVLSVNMIVKPLQ